MEKQEEAREVMESFMNAKKRTEAECAYDTFKNKCPEDKIYIVDKFLPHVTEDNIVKCQKGSTVHVEYRTAILLSSGKYVCFEDQRHDMRYEIMLSKSSAYSFVEKLLNKNISNIVKSDIVSVINKKTGLFERALIKEIIKISPNTYFVELENGYLYKHDNPNYTNILNSGERGDVIEVEDYTKTDKDIICYNVVTREDFLNQENR